MERPLDGLVCGRPAVQQPVQPATGGSALERAAEAAQLATAPGVGPRIVDVEPTESVQDDLRDDQAPVVLVVGRYHVPGRMPRAGRSNARFVGPHVVLPELALFEVGAAEFPVLVGVVDAREEPLALLLLRQVQEELDDAGAVAVEVALEAGD